MPDREAGLLAPGQELSRRAVLGLLLGGAILVLVKTAVAAAQAAWSLPGVLLPAVDHLACLALLVVALRATLGRRRQPHPSSARGCLPPGCASFVVAWVLLGLVAAGCGLTTGYGRQSTDALAPALRTGERWQANRLAYARRPVQRGDLVALTGLGPPYRAAKVVGLPGDRLLWGNDRLELVTGPVRAVPPEVVLHVPAGQVAVIGSGPGASSPLVPVWRLRGRVVAVSLPPWRLRSL